MSAPAPNLTPRATDPADGARLTARVTTLSVAVAAGLALLKLGAWSMSGSVALLASTADSGLDLVAALSTFWAVRYAMAPADREHRFGHGKAEAYASVLQAGLVLISALLIGGQAVVRLLHPGVVRAEGAAISAMVVSILVTMGLIRAQSLVIARTGSVAISGDRAHYAADLGSNLAAVAGVVGARLTGDTRLDAGAGLLVALWLLWGVWRVLGQASRHLMDREIPELDRVEVMRLALDDPEVFGVHEFRTRQSGPFMHIQMHMELDPEQTLDHAHHVIERAEQRITSAYPSADIIIHADPYGRAEPHGPFGDEGARVLAAEAVV